MPDIYCGQCAQIMSELLMSMVEKLTEERDEARAENNMLRLQLAGRACYNCGGAINPQTMHCDECVEQDAALLARVASLEKALNVTFTMLRHIQTDVPLNCTERIDVKRAIDIVRAALAGGKDSTP